MLISVFFWVVVGVLMFLMMRLGELFNVIGMVSEWLMLLLL